MLFVAADNHFQTFMTEIIGRILLESRRMLTSTVAHPRAALESVDRVIEPQIAQTLQAHAAMARMAGPSRHRWACVSDTYLLYHAISFLTSPWAVGSPNQSQVAASRNANTPGANPAYFDGLRLGISVLQLPRPLVSFNSSRRGCSPGCPRCSPAVSFASQL